MSLATPCCAGRAAICLPSGPLPTDDLSHLCALPLTTATHPTTAADKLPLRSVSLLPPSWAGDRPIRSAEPLPSWVT